MQKIVYIYALVDPRYEKVRYVGKTINLQNRYEQHLYWFDNSNPRKDRWIKGLAKHGLKPELAILEQCNQSNWEEREKYWIAYYRGVHSDLINITDGGDSAWDSLKARNARVKKFAKENNLELKRCFICGGLTISHLEICKYCLQKNFPDYEDTEWYKFLVRDDKRFRWMLKSEQKFIKSLCHSIDYRSTLMVRYCVCGKRIPHNKQLCASCIEKYGSDSSKWDEWLVVWVRSYQAELDSEKNNHNLSIDVDGRIVEPKPQFKLNGCREETHLYEDRHNH